MDKKHSHVCRSRVVPPRVVRPSVPLFVRPRVHQTFVPEFNCYEFYKLNWRIFYELSSSVSMNYRQKKHSHVCRSRVVPPHVVRLSVGPRVRRLSPSSIVTNFKNSTDVFLQTFLWCVNEIWAKHIRSSVCPSVRPLVGR